MGGFRLIPFFVIIITWRIFTKRIYQNSTRSNIGWFPSNTYLCNNNNLENCVPNNNINKRLDLNMYSFQRKSNRSGDSRSVFTRSGRSFTRYNQFSSISRRNRSNLSTQRMKPMSCCNMNKRRKIGSNRVSSLPVYDRFDTMSAITASSYSSKSANDLL